MNGNADFHKEHATDMCINQEASLTAYDRKYMITMIRPYFSNIEHGKFPQATVENEQARKYC